MRPKPTRLYHFTHIEHLESIVARGLVSDSMAQASGLVSVDVGNQGIKERRRRRTVPIEPGGVVADYVPFYFAYRSPMMFTIAGGNVPTYTRGCDDLVYLVTTIERLVKLGSSLVYTDRNATLRIATFTDDVARLDGLIDWQLMRQRMWNSTPDQLDRQERRMAECLAYQRVAWEAFQEVVTRTPSCAKRACQLLATVRPAVPIRGVLP